MASGRSIRVTPALAAGPHRSREHATPAIRSETPHARGHKKTRTYLLAALLAAPNATRDTHKCTSATFLHTMPHEHAPRTQHCATTDCQTRWRVASARSPRAQCSEQAPNPAHDCCTAHQHCTHALNLTLPGRSFMDRSVPALKATKTTKATHATNRTNAHQMQHPQQYTTNANKANTGPSPVLAHKNGHDRCRAHHRHAHHHGAHGRVERKRRRRKHAMHAAQRACTHGSSRASEWVRDLTEEGVEPNPGPTARVVSKNINGMSTYEHFHDTLQKIKTQNETTPIMAVLIQEHHIDAAKHAELNAEAEARAKYGLLYVQAHKPQHEGKGGTAIVMPLDRIELKEKENIDTAIARIKSTTTTTADGRVTTLRTLLHGHEVTVASAYAPVQNDQRAAFYTHALQQAINDKTILGIDANCVPDPRVDEVVHGGQPPPNDGATELQRTSSGLQCSEATQTPGNSQSR